MKTVRSIQYTAPGFEPTTFGTWVSYHNRPRWLKSWNTNFTTTLKILLHYILLEKWHVAFIYHRSNLRYLWTFDEPLVGIASKLIWEPQAVWPDLAKSSKSWAGFRGFMHYLGILFDWLYQILYAIGQLFIDVNCQMLKNNQAIWSHWPQASKAAIARFIEHG